MIKEAWQWKISGLYSDAQIIRKLAAYGLKISPQKLSKIWRNPFYCGININKLLGVPMKGNWEPLVSESDVIKVQSMLEGNPSGYQHKKDEEKRPLSRLLKCHDCGSYMIGYLSKKKNIHYYRCGKCRSVNLNAQTTPKARKRGADDLFLNLLSQYNLPDSLVPLVEMQLTKMFNHYQNDHLNNEQSLELKLKQLEQKKKELTIRHGLGEVNKETFELTLEHLVDQIQVIYTELNTVPRKLLNLQNLIIKSLETLKKLSVLWDSGDLECKRIIQKAVFPEGIFYDAKKMNVGPRKLTDSSL
ncbi:MAG: recombinase zinc beta ribbon domain-containing protein [Niabella sp.]